MDVGQPLQNAISHATGTGLYAFEHGPAIDARLTDIEFIQVAFVLELSIAQCRFKTDSLTWHRRLGRYFSASSASSAAYRESGSQTVEFACRDIPRNSDEARIVVLP